MLCTPPENMIEDLKDYGEDDVAAKISGLSEPDLARIGEIAFEHALTGMLLAKAVALAAVEVVEGGPRELKRKRRRFRKRPRA
jgi:hypothetical protein